MKKITIIFLPFLVACTKTPVANHVVDERQQDISHVILLAGGENCLGYSYSYHLQELDGVSDEKFNEYKKGYSSVKISYKNMLNTGLVHKEQTSFVDTRIGQGKAANEGIRYGCLGPEVGLAEYLSNMRPNETYYIIKFAGGGESSFTYQWNSENGLYYQKMVEFFDQQLNKLAKSEIDFDVSSFMFVQGESDAKNNNAGYKDNLDDFVNDVRIRYAKYAPKNGMSFIDAGISSYYLLNYRNINNDKKEVMNSDSRNFYIDTIVGNITRNQDNMDRIHYDAKGEIKLGNLFAKAYLSLRDAETTNESYSLDQRIDKPSFDDGYVVEAVKEGRYVQGNFKFASNQITADVLDDNLSENDGISIKYCFAEDETRIDISNLKKVNFYINGKIEYLRYSTSRGDFIKTSNHDEFTNIIKGINDKDGNLIGYHINTSVVNIDNHQMYISFGITQNGQTTYYHNKQIVDNDPETYPYIDVDHLSDNKNTASGQFFGSVSNLKATRGWELSNDSEHIYVAKGKALNTVYAHQRSDINMTFTASITAKGVVYHDFWPKFGLMLVDDECNGIFYYIDAYGDGYSLDGTDLGYCKVTGGTFSDYVSLDYSVGPNASVYKNNNYVSLGIKRVNDQYHFLFNGLTIKSIQNVTNIGLRNAYFGINTFNVYVDVKDYHFSD